VIKRMEEERYVQRQADPSDERISRVYLLPQGRARITKIRRAFGRLDRAMFDDMAEADLQRLRNLLAQMQRNLQGFGP
jgi:DNA-binding MarR family transcriptional regulator